MSGINPADWLQYGAMGLLGIGLVFGMAFIRSIVKDLIRSRDQERHGRDQERMALIDALQNNSAALAGLQVSIQGMQAVMLQWSSGLNVAKEKEQT